MEGKKGGHQLPMPMPIIWAWAWDMSHSILLLDMEGFSSFENQLCQVYLAFIAIHCHHLGMGMGHGTQKWLG